MAIPGYSRLFRACSRAGVSGLFRFYRHPSYTRRKIKECLNRPSFHDDNQVCVLCNRIEKKKTVHFFDYFSFSGETSVAWDQARLRSRGGGEGRRQKTGSNWKNIGERSEPTFSSQATSRLASLDTFFSPTPILSFFPQRGAWSLTKNQNRLRSH